MVRGSSKEAQDGRYPQETCGGVSSCPHMYTCFGVNKMQIILWLFSFFFLVIATLSGIGASIGLLSMDYYALCVFSAVMMFSCASWADSIGD